MIRIETILVPVDFSEASRKAVMYGLSFSLEFRSRLVLAHISDYDPAAYEKAKADLLDLVPSEYRERLDFEIIVKSGNVRNELIGIIGDRGVDLVVMGTRGRSYFQRLMLGSVTERMLRLMHVPILTVSHLEPEKELHKPEPVVLRRILYATDLAKGSEEGVKLCIRLAHAFDAALTVAHVVHADAARHGVETAAFLPGHADEVRAQAKETLSRMLALISDGSVPITTVVADGVPDEIINSLAAENNADLIVINLQEKGRLERAILGTTAERVIRTAAVPVLSLPLPATYASRWSAA